MESSNFVLLEICSMHIETTISNRFAKTLITSKVKNTDNQAKEAIFSVILPENVFISEFQIEIDGKIYNAYVKEKDEAKTTCTEAISRGFCAADVELNARGLKKFTVSVNIEPSSEIIFRLTYEELLQRQNGQYELIINVHPGQIVDDLCVEVKIDETRPLTFVKTPSLCTGNEISDDKPELDPCAKTEMINANSAKVRFNPDKEQQKKYAELLGSKDQGLAGQFVVQYDVERDPKGGEVLLRDGYFVHFFAPSGLQTLPKHVVFVLDHSGSMRGRKYEQLMQAMDKILSDLNPDDLFHIVRFSDDVSVWNLEKNKFDQIRFEQMPDYENLDTSLAELNLGEAIQVTEDNIKKAKRIKDDDVNMGCTNIIGGLAVGLYLVRRTLQKFYEKNVATKHQPMIIFLTDGLPNVGISNPDEITKIVTKINQGTNRAAIFSMSFGEDADKNFLKKLSAQNLGFSRHIYEAADAALQLQNFYRTVSSPLLRDVRFKYVDKVSEVTRIDFPIFFLGSEFVIAGRCGDTRPLRHVEAFCTNGCIEFETDETESDVSLERLWAYLTVKQLLDEAETSENRTELTKKALSLALKYSFVTSVTSLVVVKPQQNDSVGYENAAKTNIQSPQFGSPNYGFCYFSPRRRIMKKMCGGGPAVGTTFGSSPSAVTFGSSNTGTFGSSPFASPSAFCSFPGTTFVANNSLFQFGINQAVPDLNNWLSTQPHLPRINSVQVNLFLQCCDGNEERAKNLIDSYFTVRTLCPES
nr:PREDICTED: inter-alpha-trypsin inhibitor heavy chain H4-like [Tribolium castaneum]|eukprot:XP_015836303.1 PREDICTED: inter-alpha-trypsin inhibitor heavy chain H4-like [Tribolium castaneum]